MFDFVENQDFLVVTEKKVTMTDAGEKATLIKEYHITLDMAKELAMVERTEKGKLQRPPLRCSDLSNTQRT